MYKKLNQLSFVIGLFFSIVAVILIVTYFTAATEKITLFTSIVFFIFGVVMMGIKERQG